MVWIRRKSDNIDADHDKRIAENFVFDDVLGLYVPRAEYEKRARFNADGYKPTKGEISRFPCRPMNEPYDPDQNVAPVPYLQTRKSNPPRS